MNQPITQNQAEVALRKLAATQGYNIDEAIRQYALVRQVLREEKPFSPAIEAFATDFVERSSDLLMDDAEKIRQMAWPILQELYDQIRIPISDLKLAHEKNKYIHRQILDKRVLDFQKKYQMEDSYLDKDTEKDLLAINIEDYFIPLAEVEKDKVLLEAIRRNVFKLEMTEAQQSLLKDENGEEKPEVQKYKEVLAAVGFAILAHPASQVEFSARTGVNGFAGAFGAQNGQNAHISPSEKLQKYTVASYAFTQALMALHVVTENMEAGLSGTVSITQEQIANLKQFTSDLTTKRDKWEQLYNTKLLPSIRKEAQKVVSLPQNVKKWAEQLYYCLPRPLGDDPLFTDSIKEFKESLTILEKKLGEQNNRISLEAPEFFDFYTSLLLLHERMLMPLFRLQQIEQEVASLKNGESEFGGKPPAKLVEYAEACIKIATMVAEGYGDIKHPSSPHATRNQLKEQIDQINTELEPLDKAVITFLRLKKPLETLQQYTEQEIQNLSAIAPGHSNLPGAHTAARDGKTR